MYHRDIIQLDAHMFNEENTFYVEKSFKFL